MNQDQNTCKPTKARHPARILWYLVLPALIAIAVAVPLMNMRASPKQEYDALNQSPETIGGTIGVAGAIQENSADLDDINISAHSRDAESSTESGRIASLAETLKERLNERFNEDPTSRCRCIRVQLVEFGSDSYLGVLELDSGLTWAIKLTCTGAGSFEYLMRMMTRSEWEELSLCENSTEKDAGSSRDLQGVEQHSDQLELQSWRWSSYLYDKFVVAEGTVKNVTDNRLEDVAVVVVFMDENGDLVTSEAARVEYDPILPGQTSPFRVMAQSNPAIVQASIDFKKSGGGSIKWRTRSSMSESRVVRRAESVEEQTPIDDQEIEELRKCRIVYCIDAGLVTMGLSFGDLLDGLAVSPALSKSNDGRTVLTLGEGAESLKLFFACDLSSEACVITGGESNGQELDHRSALALMMSLINL